MKPPADAELVARCLADDEAAWNALTERYADLVYAVARRCGLSDIDAGDVVQEVFLALLRGLGSVKRRERLLGWILTTAQRESWRHVRRRRQALGRETSVARPELDSEHLPPEVLAALEDQQMVREAYGGIGERCRRLLDALLLDPVKHSYAEVSKDLGMPIGSIGPIRQRCLQSLKDALIAAGFLGDLPASSHDPGAAGKQGRSRGKDRMKKSARKVRASKKSGRKRKSGGS